MEEIPEVQFDNYETIRTEENEIASLRTSNSKTYQIDEQNMQTVVYTEDVHYYDASAGYQEISNAIIENSAQYGNTFYHLANEANAYSAHFADSDEDELVRINYRGKAVSITPVALPEESPAAVPTDEAQPDEAIADAAPSSLEAGAAPEETKTDAAFVAKQPQLNAEGPSPTQEASEKIAEPQEGIFAQDAPLQEPIENVVTAQQLSSSLEDYLMFENSESLNQLVYPENSVLYENILPHVDILYQTDNDKLKEYIVIKEQIQQNEFFFDYALYGVVPFTDENGKISFRDEMGEEIFLIDDLFAVDDNGVITQEVSCEIVSTQGGITRIKVTLDEEYLSAPDRAFPVVIDPSTMVSGSSTTKDTYVNQAAPSTNYYLNNYLKVGHSGGYEMWSLIKFDLPSIPAANVTNAKIRLKYDSGTRPSSLYANRVTGSWTSNGVCWNNRPSVNMGSDAPNRSTKGALDGADWYVLHVTTSTKNMLSGAASNHGWKIHDAGLTTASANTTYRSSDYASPYKPELVIDHTGSTTPPSTTYGSRAYESSTGGGQNCMGYALDIQQFIDYKVLFETYSTYATDSDRTAINQSKNYTDLMTVVERVMRRYMNDKLGYNGYTAISSYNSSIGSNSYRTVMRLGFRENDGVTGWNLNYLNNGVDLKTHDEWDFHWWYQIKDGRWAEKNGNMNSQIVPGSSGTKNPGASIWEGSVKYASACKYYAIKMH